MEVFRSRNSFFRELVTDVSMVGFCFFQKGFVMIRFFGLVLAVVAMVQSADAALLSAWNFEGNAKGSSATGTPGNFINNGNGGVGSHGIPGSVVDVGGLGRWRTGTNITNTTSAYSATKFNSFNYTSAKAETDFTELKFNARRTNGNSGTPTVFANVRYSIDGGPEVNLGTKSITTLTMSPFSFTNPIFLAAGSVIDFRVYWAAQGNTTTAELDDLELHGTSQNVPEPASIAVFGLLGAGVAFRRMRRNA